MAKLKQPPLLAVAPRDPADLQTPSARFENQTAAPSVVLATDRAADRAAVDMLAMALCDIASEAAALRGLLLKSVRSSKPVSSAAVAQLDRIGYLADSASAAVGAPAFQPAADWMLSPRLQELLREVKGARHG